MTPSNSPSRGGEHKVSFVTILMKIILFLQDSRACLLFVILANAGIHDKDYFQDMDSPDIYRGNDTKKEVNA